MKLDSKEAKSILVQMEKVKIGERLKFKGFLDGLGTLVEAHCVEIVPNKFWQFALSWNSVFIQSVVVEVDVVKKELIVDTLGA
jgi:hypothetical protein